MQKCSKTKRDAGGIYIVKSMVDDRMIVGSTNSFLQRFFEYKSQLSRGLFKNKNVQNLANEIGVENLKFEVIQECDQKLFFRAIEDSYISYFKSIFHNSCLNVYTAYAPPTGVVPPQGKPEKSIYCIKNDGLKVQFKSCSDAARQTGLAGPSIGQAASAKYSRDGNRFYKIGEWYFND